MKTNRSARLGASPGTAKAIDAVTRLGEYADAYAFELASGWGRIGFYTSGQLALEDYYTLGVIGKAGIGTPHMDGNTRLCTATAAAALKVSFGTDGQPGSYARVLNSLCEVSDENERTHQQ